MAGWTPERVELLTRGDRVVVSDSIGTREVESVLREHVPGRSAGDSPYHQVVVRWADDGAGLGAYRSVYGPGTLVAKAVPDTPPVGG